MTVRHGAGSGRGKRGPTAAGGPVDGSGTPAAAGMDRQVLPRELARMVSHEVRNALSVLCNVSTGLHRSLRSEEGNTRLLLEILDEEIARLERLTRDLMAYGSPLPSMRAEVEVHDLLERAVAEVRQRCPGSGETSIEVRVGGGVSRVALDPARMQEAVAGLLHNAVEASRGRGPVRVEATQEAGRLRIDVTDEGGGIRPEDLERIFEPFFSTKPSGFGLSLALCRQIARSHGGDVQAMPGPEGRGSRFRIEIPGAEAGG